jgi:hypothetical protein
MSTSPATTEWRKKAFDSAQETTKQVIALAAGVLTISVTFHQDLQKAKTHPATWPLQWSWVCYAVSVAAGVLTLMALTGNLERSEGEPTIYGWNIRWSSLLQLVAFAAGIGLTTAYAWNVLSA